MLTTSRRFASSRWFFAARPSVTIVRRSARSWASRSPPCLVGDGQALLGEQAGLDPLCQVDLLLGGEQLGAADAVEVSPDEVGGDAALVLDGVRGSSSMASSSSSTSSRSTSPSRTSTSMPEIAPVAVVLLRLMLVVATVCRLPGVVSAFAAADRVARDVVTRISVPAGALSLGEAAGAVDNG